jgi:ATP-dependent Zn protease
MGLQSLLVVMDGIDNPPFMRKLMTNKVNLWLDALYVVPQSIGGVKLRLPKAKPTSNQIYFVGATNVALEALDPALTRAGRMGRHIHFRSPTKRDRSDILDLYLGKVAHADDVDIAELTRLTAGYSPADIEQVCSIALTYASFDGREAANRADFMEAMVTNEAGTALGWGYESKDEEYSTAVHEAGHAVAAYLFKEGQESTRLSIQRRGQTGGHHQAVDKEERAFQTRSECFADLVWGLGAYAAETVCFGENTQGVGGDLMSTAYLAGTMVARWGMTPYPVQDEATARKLRKLGQGLLAFAGPPDVQLPPMKQQQETTLVGQAYLAAYNVAVQNEEAIRAIADRLVRDKEIFGQDLVDLLASSGLVMPDWRTYDSAVWPFEASEPDMAEPGQVRRGE